MEPRTDRIKLPKHIYLHFIEQYVLNNPGHKVVKRRNTARAMPYELHNECGEILLTYDRWFNMITTFFGHARNSIIEGERLSFVGMGCIHGKRVQRNYRNRRMNWKETMKHGYTINEETGKKVPVRKVYFTETEYCRIGWTDRPKVLKPFKFAPTNSSHSKKGFKEQFSDALIQNPHRKLLYTY